MVCSAVSLCFFACRVEVETLGLTGFLNVRRKVGCDGQGAMGQAIKICLIRLSRSRGQ